MLKEKEFPVYGDNGLKGTLLSTARFLDASPEKRLRLEDGREIMVPSSALIAQPDGSYYFRSNGEPEPPAAAPPPAPEQVIEAHHAEPEYIPEPARLPEPIDRQPQPEPRQVFAPSAAGPLFREDCDVERVPIRRMIDQPAEIRQDGDTLIIPLMEEVLVVEKRLMLREELHIRRRRETKAGDDRTPIPSSELKVDELKRDELKR